jgi:hypothetical protein
VIKAIPTFYNGHSFRSRLEARWAVFFDAMGVHYEYEPQGFDIDGVWYLPDFYIPDWKLYLEIKPEKYWETEPKLYDEALEKLCRLVHQGTKAWMICGRPFANSYVFQEPFNFEPSLDFAYKYWAHWSYIFSDCRRCAGISFEYEGGWGEIGTHTCGDHDSWPFALGSRIVKAYNIAARTKFDATTPDKVKALPAEVGSGDYFVW